MGIIKLEDKYVSRNEVQLHPRRQFISSSSGITGSLFVFPNRSETQKDNIDERLEFAGIVDGEEIKPYDANSLEARRKEIYEGNFSKFTVSPFTDATQYEYTYTDTNDNSNDGDYTGEILNEHIFVDSTIVPTIANPPVVTAKRINEPEIVYEWSSDGYWRTQNGFEVYRRLPTSDRDLSAKNYEVPLAILLDGANEFTKEHAWRATAKKYGELADLYELYQNDPTNPEYADYAQYQTYYDQGWRSGNSSFTNTPNPELYQFSGLKVEYDETDTPYEGAPISTKAQVNVWPPEIDKWDTAINTNWVMKGYSDLSMHPRNKTQKNVELLRCTEDYFSKASFAQRQLYNRLGSLNASNAGWWVKNYHCLSLSSYDDTDGNTKLPCLAYWNDRSGTQRYKIGWDSSDAVTIEFWVKPCQEQTQPGTICHLPNNHAIVLLPYEDSLVNGIYHRYKVAMYVQAAAGATRTPASSDVTSDGASNAGIYVTDAVLELNKWSHVAIRWSENFNNGLLSVFVDGKLETSLTEDGVYAGSRTGLVNTSWASTSEYTYTIGGWQSSAFKDVFGSYATEQDLKETSVMADYDTGYAIDPILQLKSELTEFRIWNKARTLEEILETKAKGLDSAEDLRFYVNFGFNPIEDVPKFNRYIWMPDTQSGSKQKYYKEAANGFSKGNLSYNKVPFCTNNAYVAGVPIVQPHSFLQDLANNVFPVITGMPMFTVAESWPGDSQFITANGFMKNVMETWKSIAWLRNLNSMIMPCDNGSFIPSFGLNSNLLHREVFSEAIKMAGSGIGDASSDYEIARFLDDEVFSVDSVAAEIDSNYSSGDGFQASAEQYKTSKLIEEGKLKDADFVSPLSLVINIPQLYYGNRIRHESVILKWNSNTEGKEIIVKDFEGALYRMNSRSNVKTAKVGHIDYENGILCVFSPLLTSLGIDNFDISFQGQKNMHVLQADIPCNSGVANISSNETYKNLKASANANETDGNVTYISTIYLHDSNLNIIGKVNLAQPIVKREEDSFVFRVKLDF